MVTLRANTTLCTSACLFHGEILHQEAAVAAATLVGRFPRKNVHDVDMHRDAHPAPPNGFDAQPGVGVGFVSFDAQHVGHWDLVDDSLTATKEDDVTRDL